MKRTCLFLIMALPAASGRLGAAEPELKGSPAELSNYLTGQQTAAAIIGEAEVKVPADRAIVTLRLNSENKSLKDASQADQKLRSALTAYLADHGIGADRIQSAKFSSTPKTGTFSDKVKSYRIESRIDVVVHDDKEFQTAAGSIDKWADVTYAGVKFEHSEKEALRLKAISQACDIAMARKKTYEERLGVKLTVKRFNESGDFRLPVYFGDRERIGTQGGTSPSNILSSGLPARTSFSGLDELSSGFGELIFKARVGIECSLETR